MSAHDRYLQRALVLAKQNIADGGRPFGAVLVRNDEIVAESVNTFHLSGDPTAHAELNAVRDLAARQGSAALRVMRHLCQRTTLPYVPERSI